MNLRALPLLLLLGVASACASSVPRRDPVGERFPSVAGTSLAGDEVRLPEAFAGAPVVLLVGYEMKTQFDLDRWILGLLQAETPVPLVEVPTIPGLLPGAFAGKIDQGMQSGIPSEDWGSVVTLYRGDASAVAAFTGNQGPRNGRVLLLDAQGVVRWFHDRGYSGGTLLALDRAARGLVAQED